MESNPLERLYSVFANTQTYANLLYLLLGFPLGLAYFIFLVTGISLGIGLLVIWVGLFILAGVIALSWALTHFERQLAITILKIDIPTISKPSRADTALFVSIKDHLSDPATWKGIAFLFLKFPIGLVSFVIAAILISISVSFTLAPFVYPWVSIKLGAWEVNSLTAALVAGLLGLIFAPLSLHVLNQIATWEGLLARSMLGGASTNVTSSASPLPVTSAAKGILDLDHEVGDQKNEAHS